MNNIPKDVADRSPIHLIFLLFFMMSENVSNRRYFCLDGKVINSVTIEECFLFHWSDNFIIIPSSFIMWIIQFPFCLCLKHSEQSPLGEERVYLAHTCRAHSVIEEVRMGLDGKPACCSVMQHYFWSGNSSTAKEVQQKREGVLLWLPGGSTLTSPPAQGVLPPMVARALLKHRHAHRPVSPRRFFSWDSLLGCLSTASSLQLKPTRTVKCHAWRKPHKTFRTSLG